MQRSLQSHTPRNTYLTVGAGWGALWRGLCTGLLLLGLILLNSPVDAAPPVDISPRADAYRPMVRQVAESFDLDPALILAFIQVESSFNPRAASSSGAHGLMQLRPNYAARDAYRYLFDIDRQVPVSYLENPQRNVQLGCAYLYLLENHYFASIEDPQSRLFCVIAAYHSGPGNVARVFSGRTSFEAAARVVNCLPPPIVRVRLIESLAGLRACRYLDKVQALGALYAASEAPTPLPPGMTESDRSLYAAMALVVP